MCRLFLNSSNSTRGRPLVNMSSNCDRDGTCNTYTERYFVPDTDKVKINLHVFYSLMLHRVGGQVLCTDIITIYQCCTVRRTSQLVEKLRKPTGSRDCICHRPVFGLRTRTRADMLSFWGPCHKVVAKIDTIIRCWSLGVQASGPICIWICDNVCGSWAG
jgi:hypothetical protein